MVCKRYEVDSQGVYFSSYNKNYSSLRPDDFTDYRIIGRIVARIPQWSSSY